MVFKSTAEGPRAGRDGGQGFCFGGEMGCNELARSLALAAGVSGHS